MNCPKCGAPGGKNQEYCSSCGYPLNNGGNPGGGKKKMPIYALLLIVAAEIAVIAVIVGLLLFHNVEDSSEPKKEATPTEAPQATEAPKPTESPEPTETSKPTEAPKQPTQEPAAVETAVEWELVTKGKTIKGLRKNHQKISIDKAVNSVASTTIRQEKVQNPPVNLLDDDPLTNWQEGAEGSGIGEYTEFTFDREYPVAGLTFRLGNWKSEEYFWGNNRPKTLRIELGNQSWSVTFPDEWKEFAVKFAEPVPTGKLRLTIEEVYRGSDWDDTVITDASVWY